MTGKKRTDEDEALRERLRPLYDRLAREGRMRREDDAALVMYPEGLDIDEAKMTETMIVCGNCRGLEEVRHVAPFDDLVLPPCPLCKVQAWEKTDVEAGECPHGRLSAPRLPSVQPSS